MKESVTYQAIVAEGVRAGRVEGIAEGAREVLLGQGEDRFGEPAPAWAAAALKRIDDMTQLESLAKRLLHVDTWAELLPKPSKPSRRRKNGS